MEKYHISDIQAVSPDSLPSWLPDPCDSYIYHGSHSVPAAFSAKVSRISAAGLSMAKDTYRSKSS